MGMKRKLKWIGIFLCVLLILSLIPAYWWTQANVKNMDRFYNSKLSPVICIPGSSATENRFDGMVAKINERSETKHSLIKVKVWNDGHISLRGKKLKNDNEPFIVVGFENNHDGYGNIKKQANMFNDAFSMLQDKYRFNNYKGIGHSNGGLVYTAFLENDASNYPEVKMKRLLTIGTPYNFEESNIKHRTQMLSDFIKKRKYLSKDLDVYTLAGNETYTSDGIVPDASVRAGKYIFQNQTKSYTEVTLTGNDTQHSNLPQNNEVLQIIMARILDHSGGPMPDDPASDSASNVKPIESE
ncbi:alpha/beta hydrolase [Weissella uvarum]|uniref:alpha/beta hydrolase n=1 Tax=Weissella uvarum TaxID=1479233 RepID=UPI003B82D670